MQSAGSFSFTYRGVPTGCRKARSMSAMYVGRLMVEDVAECDAPLLCEVVRVDGDGPSSEIATPYRVARGGVWTPSDHDLHGLMASAVKSAAEYDRSENDVQTRIALELANHRDHHLSIGGVLYEKTAEPVSEISFHRTFHYGDSITVEVTTEPSSEDTYRLDEGALLETDIPGIIATHGLNRGYQGKGEIDIDRRATVRLYRPDLLTRRGNRSHRTSFRLAELRKTLYAGRSCDLLASLDAVLENIDATALPDPVTNDGLLAAREAIARLSAIMRTKEDE